MAMRRRIKVAVNLATARKPKQEPPDHAPGSSIIVKAEPAEKTSEILVIEPEQITESYRPNVTPKSEPTFASKTETVPLASKTEQSDKNAFKCPPKVEFSRSNSYTASHTTDDVQNIEIDDGVQVMQMDLQNTANTMSPLKSQRHRIKPTPVFGQRRNSFVGTPTTPAMASDDVEQVAHTPRRERHYSGSQSSITANLLNHTPGRTRTESSSSQKRERHYSGSQNAGSSSNVATTKSVGRIRTESTCSVYSDSHLSTISKSRKTEDQNSQRLSLRREFEARFSNGVPDKASLKMADLIYYNPVTNPMEQKPKITEIKAEVQEPDPEKEKAEKDNSAVPVPQLKLNAKGELILDDKSLEIETTAEQEARKVLAKSSLIFLDENTGMNGFYKRHKRTRDWPADETIRFFRCLQTIGTDFSMMSQLFPKRTRRDLKLKFKKEERCNAALINKALLHPNSFDIQELKDQFEVEDREREEEERERKAAKEKEKQAKKEYKKITIRESKSARALKNAQDAYKLLEGHLGEGPSEEEPPIKKRKPRATRKKVPELTDAEKPDGEKTQTKRIRKPRQTKAKANKEKVQQNLSAEFIEPPMKMEQEELMTDDPTYPIYEITSLDGDMIPPDTIQQEFSMLVQDENLDRQQQSDAEMHQQHYSTDDEAPRTFVNLDSGDLTKIQKTEASCKSNDLTKKEAPHLSNDILYAAEEEYSDMADAYSIEENDAENAEMGYYDNVEMTETIDKKPQITSPIEKPTSTTQMTETRENNPQTVVERPIQASSPLPTPQSQKQAIEIDNEMAIQQILEDIASGTLQVVSSYDPDDPDEMVTEIFMVDPKTGDLCDEPLDLPTDLVQSILAVMM